MVILLKTLCFALWMIIMLALIVGSRRTTASIYQLYLEDTVDGKRAIRREWAKK